jgi:addiction module HigA family antidote
MGNLGYGYTPTHPGEVLKDEIEYRGISQTRLAKQMGISYNILNDILNERRPLTIQTAMMFEAALNIPADSLMRLQLKYNMHVAQSDSKLSKRLAEIRKAAALL